jgi:2-methylcitrate dehydratase PrpD
VTLRDGSVIAHRRDYPKGDPHDPRTDRELEEKAKKNFCLIMDESTADEIIRRIRNLDNEETIAGLVAPLQQNRMV